MKHLLKRKISNQKLMLRLFMNFMIIIVLFVSFSMISLFMFKDSMQEEILKYNDANLHVTTRSFEQYFQTLTSVLVDLQLNNGAFKDFTQSSRLDYISAAKLIDVLYNTTTNPQLYLNDLFVYNAKLPFVLDKVRGSEPAAMFGEHHVNSRYTNQFWTGEMAKPFVGKLYAMAGFTQRPSIAPMTESGDVFPFMVKNKLNPNYFILAFIDGHKLIGNLHQSINNNLYILDERGQPLFAYDSKGTSSLPELDPDNDWVKSGDHYYFYKKGAATGLTYVNVVPDSNVSRSIERLNVLLVALLVIASAIGILASVYFSVRYSNPVRKIVESIRQTKNMLSPEGRVNEFELIQQNIGHMIQVNRDVLQDLEEKNSLLRYYSFMNKLKRIRDNMSHASDSDHSDRPYRFVLVDLNFRQEYREELQKDASYYIREYIHQAIRHTKLETLTFQIEGDQILSVVYGDESDEQVFEALKIISSVLAEDRTYCFFTLAVSSLYTRSDMMKEAYDEVQRLTDHRPFDDETRIIGPGEQPEIPFLPYGSIEQEIHVNLQEGNDAHVIESLRKLTVQMAQRYSKANFHQFAREVTGKVFRKLHALQLDTVCVCGLPEVIRHIHTVEELNEYFETLLSEAGRLIRLKKEEHDPIVHFVAAYMEEHYKEEISLDLMAGKINITGGYLSTYFKEKTGINFVDYVNEFRIKKAMDMLLDSETRIHDIALLAGYQSLSSFNRAFKKFSGVTPSEYRRNNLQPNASDSA
ncbi:helix-turn-helix domain-containing protein [Paenibacillus spongiae]|uniref:AraC family transcriptional regulator n=1 Tax=Paenibacillus spongiae TaxID=2909671 RepID=A0ABY5SAU7_9BACL|nr:AraC family transcriptional regulator [Paenibacillus spongiae]UVI31072.1 AraC family transcriptional regulator [Paenibacillus spongiae]